MIARISAATCNLNDVKLDVSDLMPVMLPQFVL